MVEVVWVKYASSLLDNYHCVADLGGIWYVEVANEVLTVLFFFYQACIFRSNLCDRIGRLDAFIKHRSKTGRNGI